MSDKKINQAAGDDEYSNASAWYQVKFTWLVFALPLSAVIAGLTTVWIAFSGADALVVDNYYKEGLAINRKQDTILMAKKLGVSVALNIDNDYLVVSLDQGQAQPTPTIAIFFTHPTLADSDFQLKARVASPGSKLVLPLPKKLSGNWRVQIVPEHDQWQLQNQWQDLSNNTQLIL